jgi:hypothetical protein
LEVFKFTPEIGGRRPSRCLDSTTRRQPPDPGLKFATVRATAMILLTICWIPLFRRASCRLRLVAPDADLITL